MHDVLCCKFSQLHVHASSPDYPPHRGTVHGDVLALPHGSDDSVQWCANTKMSVIIPFTIAGTSLSIVVSKYVSGTAAAYANVINGQISSFFTTNQVANSTLTFTTSGDKLVATLTGPGSYKGTASATTSAVLPQDLGFTGNTISVTPSSTSATATATSSLQGRGHNGGTTGGGGSNRWSTRTIIFIIIAAFIFLLVVGAIIAAVIASRRAKKNAIDNTPETTSQ